MWNGRLDLANELVAPDCIVHQPPHDVRGAEGVRTMVEMGQAHFFEITFRGIDIWRIEDGKIVEYWVSSDGLHLMAQLNPV